MRVFRLIGICGCLGTPKELQHVRRDIQDYRCLCYGVASVSRIDTIICVFGKRALYKIRYSAKETYNISILLTVATPYIRFKVSVHTSNRVIRMCHARGRGV